jgi:hypothetical protein
MITGLAKISHLNLMPLQWSRRSEAMITHPSTMRRLQRIARSCAMPEAYLQQLIESAQHAAHGSDSYAESLKTPGLVDAGNSALRAQRYLLILVAFHILPAVAIAFLTQTFVPPETRWHILLGGSVVCVLLYAAGLLSVGYAKGRYLAKTAVTTLRERVEPFTVEQGIPVGFAPTASPRFFVSGYNWDHGLLFLGKEKIVFVGEHCALGLKRDQIRTLALGPGAPSWGSWKRVYFSWEDCASGDNGVFNLIPLTQTNLFGPDARALYLRIRDWRNNRGEYINSGDDAFGAPNFGTITSMSPKELGKLSRTFPLSLFMLFLAFGLSALLKLDFPWYAASIVFLIRIFEMLPYWFYHDRPAVLVRDRAAIGQPQPVPPPPPPTPGLVPPPPPPDNGKPDRVADPVGVERN